MATSIVEQIAVKILAALTTMDADDTYETSTAGAVRPTRISSFQPKDFRVVLTQGDLSRNDAMSCPGNPPAQAWDIQFNVACIVRQSETSTTAVDTLKNNFWGEIVQALTVGATWPKWDGLALNSYIRGVENYQAGDGQDAGVMIKLDVLFRTSELDPYTLRA